MNKPNLSGAPLLHLPVENEDREDSVAADASDLVIPVIAESIQVRKVPVETAAVRIRKAVHEEPETIRELLASQQVELERVPLDQIVDSPPSVRMEGDVMIIPVVEEILVITKKLRLKEELRVITKHLVSEHLQEVLLRKEELIVERTNSSEK